MKKYKLIGPQFSWPSFTPGKIYDASYASSLNYTVECYANNYPNDWELVEDFPEKWCIKGCREMENWQLHDMHDKTNVGLHMSQLYYYTNDSKLLIWEQQRTKPEGYTEITFEQFKKYILKQSDMKIIGYKLKESCKEFNIAAATIEGYLHCGNSNVTTKHFIIGEHDEAIEKWNRAKVLNLWFEPVYEEEKKLPRINNYEGSYDGKIIKYGCAEFNESALRKLYECKNIGNNRVILEFRLSSGVTITFAQLEEIIDYLDSRVI